MKTTYTKETRSKAKVVCRLFDSRYRLAILVLIILPFLLASCGLKPLYYDGIYHGRVIDSKSNEPIEGAVVLGVWYKEFWTAGGTIREFYDTRETVTDENGEFKVWGMGPRVMTFLEGMYVVVLKVGYENVGLRSWESLKNSIYYRDRVKWDGGKAVIPLDKWNIEQRRKRFSVRVGAIPDEKQRLLLDEISKEKAEIKKQP
ncbi:lipoprotein [Desulfosarcina alkanivorans]|uniref:Lipoprotein n=1 Tax=Desulfosarcina alkanivorans TaxID=571177 RepID=A0A5K7YGW7_9BACT|nr:hypothetical protein [Desulfosarcina alkanivorans]BBO68852.1 lipoprotein [Desulfosarcina alkanivorans]